VVVIVVVVGAIVFAAVRSRQRAEHLRSVLTAGSCRLDGKTDLGRDHVANPTYSVDPPSGGEHMASPAGPGEYGAGNAPPDGQLVHSLEHGYIVLWRQPGLADNDMTTLRGVLASFDRDVLLVPRATLRVPVAAVAWHHRLLCGQIEQPTLVKFVEAYRNKGPERVPHR